MWSILAIINASGGASKVHWLHSRYSTVGSINLTVLKPSLGSQEKNSTTLSPYKTLDLMSRTVGKYLSVVTEGINPLIVLPSRTQEFWPVVQMAHCPGSRTAKWWTSRALCPVCSSLIQPSFPFAGVVGRSLLPFSTKIPGLIAP